MGKLKFAVWCKDKKEWEKDNIFLCANGDLYDSQHHMVLNTETHIVCLYTGIDDVKGVGIYEGDIVKCTETLGDRVTEYISPVWWESCCFLVRESEDCDVELGMFDGNGGSGRIPLTEIEVVGNGYKNPDWYEELMKDE